MQAGITNLTSSLLTYIPFLSLALLLIKVSSTSLKKKYSGYLCFTINFTCFFFSVFPTQYLWRTAFTTLRCVPSAPSLFVALILKGCWTWSRWDEVDRSSTSVCKIMHSHSWPHKNVSKHHIYFTHTHTESGTAHMWTRALNSWRVVDLAMQDVPSQSNPPSPEDLFILAAWAAAPGTLSLQVSANPRTCFCLEDLRFGFWQDSTYKALNALETCSLLVLSSCKTAIYLFWD